jgi:hypothetical protein
VIGWTGIQARTTVFEAQIIRMPASDRCGVLAVIEFQPPA